MKVEQTFWLQILLVFTLWSIYSCQNTPSEIPVSDTLFTTIPSSYSNIHFKNQLTQTEEFNTYTYRNFFNGAGVGLGDINNDGLIDLYFCGNQEDNKLYLNKGNFQFEDITEKAGVACPKVWSTGVSFADLNGDGWLDIYVTKSGPPGGDRRYNELFINNQDGTFTEKAKEFGIAEEGLSVHAAFFDYDRDGDLDMYLLNNSMRSVGGYDLRPGQREIRDPNGGNKLFNFENGKFTDVSEGAGIYGSNIGFGLGVTVGDINRDGWLDIYVSNDFFERDYMYLNNQNGTFTEALEEHVREISMGSMGADMADINNDGLPEIFVTDMLPEDNRRQKTKTVFENWDKYQRSLKSGYYHQFTRNVLQLNSGKNPNANDQNVYFSEISRMTGVYATDWSWGALIMDMDNDGNKDIFVANGIYKDLTDQDYIRFYSNPNNVREIINSEDKAILKLIDRIPSEALPNYAFRNEGNLAFSNKALEWGLAEPSFSNGSAYGDLDNDGDLDLVVNNVNASPFIYRNESGTISNYNYLSIKCLGEGMNTFALGTQVEVHADGKIHYQELNPMRGFQSTVAHRLHFGMGGVERVDSLKVVWPDGRISIEKEVKLNQLLILDQKDAQRIDSSSEQKEPPNLINSLNLESNKWFQKSIKTFPFQHVENTFSDFDRDQLLYHGISTEGPKVAIGDVNKDGRDDLFFCGAKDSPGALLIQTQNGGFVNQTPQIIINDQKSEDTDCLFFDANSDGKLDLYVTSGGNEFSASASQLRDRLYFNQGNNQWLKSEQLLPAGMYENTSCVEATDYDQDGDLDLFVGARIRPFLIGVPVTGFILENDGKGKFKNVTYEIAPELKNIGMITDAKWIDFDNDKDQDLVVVGDYMPISVFKNEDGKFVKTIIEKSNGFWTCLEVADIDNDMDLDLVLGNHGLNSRFKASPNRPIRMYINDFDQNRTAEQIITTYNGDKAYPFALRHDLVKQMPYLKKKYLKYDNYKDQTVEDIFEPQQFENALILEVFETRTSVAINDGSGNFDVIPLPIEAQFSPVFGIEVADFDQDGNKDILLGGNFYNSKPEVGIYDASYGTVLKGNGKGIFNTLKPKESGIFIKGQIRDFDLISIGTRKALVVAKNDQEPEIYYLKN